MLLSNVLVNCNYFICINNCIICIFIFTKIIFFSDTTVYWKRQESETVVSSHFYFVRNSWNGSINTHNFMKLKSTPNIICHSKTEAVCCELWHSQNIFKTPTSHSNFFLYFTKFNPQNVLPISLVKSNLQTPPTSPLNIFHSVTL